MYKRAFIKVLCSLVFASSMLVYLPAVEARNEPGSRHSDGGKDRKDRKERGDRKGRDERKNNLSAGQAANRAQSMHGGKVLKVSREGNYFRVKLLQKSGRVITVKVKE